MGFLLRSVVLTMVFRWLFLLLYVFMVFLLFSYVFLSCLVGLLLFSYGFLIVFVCFPYVQLVFS